ncbi:hypothetical protein PVAG01_05282 [Phlyctema vagabunda]|uniref:Subtelomeric hrmA-associated cluster protein AFUB-079030/YDR124W-like helical bundle domain-containing protein n=1 Tax=Phlyctema vagabunda TaxID=108571 RepID=A0ABR4PJQ4_9HELO
MVQQHGNPHATRDFSIPSRDVANWSAERSFDRPTENQFHDPAPYHTTSSVHPKGLSIENALKQCVGLHDLKDFCLLTVMRNGEKKNYSSDHLAFQDVYRQFNTDSLSALPVFPNDNNSLAEFEGRAPNGRRHRKQSAPSEDSSSATRRRRHALNGQEDDDGALTRKRHRGRGDEDEQSQPIPTINTQQLSIGDDEEVTRFYVNRFKDLQQNACKVMGKVFVKLVEPKKQTHYPYTKGASKCPPWWPPTTGENYVRHKEPDHLLKHERIKLLVHILLMIVEPVATQAPAVTKLGLNVKKLEDVTMEAMNAWFNDKDHPANAKKRPYLKEIFKVAKQQERYKNGEIGMSSVGNMPSYTFLLSFEQMNLVK